MSNVVSDFQASILCLIVFVLTTAVTSLIWLGNTETKLRERKIYAQILSENDCGYWSRGKFVLTCEEMKR